MAFEYVQPIEITDAVLVDSTVAEDDFAEWDSGTTYAAGDQVIIAAEHKVYESAAGGNLNNDPLSAADSPIWWLEVSATNRWKMFDGSPQSQTTATDTLTVQLAPGQYVNAVAGINLSAASARVRGLVETTGEVYDETIDLVSDEGVLDYYEYFFSPVEFLTEFYRNDLPPYAEAVWHVTLFSTAGEEVAFGELILGQAITLGNTQWGPRLGIDDYSLKATDDFGVATVVERGYARTGEFTLILTPAQVSPTYNRLAALRATPVLYVGDPDYGVTLIYGFYQDFTVEIAGPTHSYCTLSIKGLT